MELQQLEEAIARRAIRSALDLPDAGVTGLATHARQVFKNNERYNLTTITEPEEFIERHFGESFEGATLVEPGAQGVMFDLGSGNGFPGLPFHVARPGLDPVLAEVSTRKAAFLTASCLGAGFTQVQVLKRQIQRPADLPDGMIPNYILTRAMGSWEKVLPPICPWAGSRGPCPALGRRGSGSDLQEKDLAEIQDPPETSPSRPGPRMDLGSGERGGHLMFHVEH